MKLSTTTYHSAWISLLLLFFLAAAGAPGCGDNGAPAHSDAGAPDASNPDAGAPAACALEPLPLQNPRAHTLGETFYLPIPQDAAACPEELDWIVSTSPAASHSQVYDSATSGPRFTPDLPGAYVIEARRVPGSAVPLHVVERSPAERFRNHYLTPLYGAARVGDQIWTANGATYTVTRVAQDSTGAWTAQGEITVASWPAAIAWREPLPYALVAHRGSDTIGFVDRERGVLEDALWVGDEPTGIAISPDAKRAYVSLPTMDQVAVIDLDSREVLGRHPAGRDPRAVVLSSDGRWLYVASFRSGNRDRDLYGSYGETDDRDLRVLDTATMEEVMYVPAVSSVLRALALSDDGSELYIAAMDGDPVPSQAAADAESFVHQAIAVSVAEGGMLDQVRDRRDLTRQPSSAGPAVNAAGVLAVGDALWVTAESSDVVVILDRATLAERARATVGAGPRQLVRMGDVVAVHCFQSLELWILDLQGDVVATVPLASDARPPAIALGERVFTRPGGRFATNHACSSCHVESQNEGMIWRFGPDIWHNVRPLQLLAATTPLEWGAYVSNTENFGYQGPSSIMGQPATPEEAEGMHQFLASLLGAPRATGYTRPDGSYTQAGLRGKQLFEELGCAGCHAPPLYTSRAYIAMGKSGVAADVPTLLGVYRHKLYFVNGQARTLEQAVAVAADYVDTTLTPAEGQDLLAFLRQLTPKGGHPLAIWPDIDSDQGVYSDVQPWVEFADPVDDSIAGRTAAQVAADHVTLEDDAGQPVATTVVVDGFRITAAPQQPLAPGGHYRFLVAAGLPFQSGGALWADRAVSFQVARPAAGQWPASMRMTVQVPGPGGVTPLSFALTRQEARPGGLTVTVAPLVFGTQQRQTVWLRLDDQQVLMQPLALPIAPTGGVANAAEITGTATVEAGMVTRVEGTLRIQGPGIDIPGVQLVMTPE